MKNKENADSKRIILKDMDIAKFKEFNQVFKIIINVMINTRPFSDVSHFLKIFPQNFFLSPLTIQASA